MNRLEWWGHIEKRMLGMQKEPMCLFFPQGLTEITPKAMAITDGFIASTKEDSLNILNKLKIQVNPRWTQPEFYSNVMPQISQKDPVKVGAAAAEYFNAELLKFQYGARKATIEVVDFDQLA